MQGSSQPYCYLCSSEEQYVGCFTSLIKCHGSTHTKTPLTDKLHVIYGLDVKPDASPAPVLCKHCIRDINAHDYITSRLRDIREDIVHMYEGQSHVEGIHGVQENDGKSFFSQTAHSSQTCVICRSQLTTRGSTNVFAEKTHTSHTWYSTKITSILSASGVEADVDFLGGAMCKRCVRAVNEEDRLAGQLMRTELRLRQQLTSAGQGTSCGPPTLSQHQEAYNEPSATSLLSEVKDPVPELTEAEITDITSHSQPLPHRLLSNITSTERVSAETGSADAVVPDGASPERQSAGPASSSIPPHQNPPSRLPPSQTLTVQPSPRETVQDEISASGSVSPDAWPGTVPSESLPETVRSDQLPPHPSSEAMLPKQLLLEESVHLTDALSGLNMKNLLLLEDSLVLDEDDAVGSSADCQAMAGSDDCGTVEPDTQRTVHIRLLRRSLPRPAQRRDTVREVQVVRVGPTDRLPHVGTGVRPYVRRPAVGTGGAQDQSWGPGRPRRPAGAAPALHGTHRLLLKYVTVGGQPIAELQKTTAQSAPSTASQDCEMRAADTAGVEVAASAGTVGLAPEVSPVHASLARTVSDSSRDCLVSPIGPAADTPVADNRPADTPADNSPEDRSPDTGTNRLPVDTAADSRPADSSADTSADNRPPDRSADSRPPDTSADNRPLDRSADSRPPDTSADNRPLDTSAASGRIHSSADPRSDRAASDPTAQQLSVSARHRRVNGLFSCEVCSEAFPMLRSLLHHERSVHTEELYPCPLCNRRFSLPKLVRKHQRTHRRTVVYECSECGEKCGSQPALLAHLSVHAGREGQLTCVLCHRDFPDTDQYRQHVRTHTQSRHVCERCGAAFSRPSHLRSHQGRPGCAPGPTRPQVTCQWPGCGRQFAQVRQLTRHQLQHLPADGPPWRCVVCQKVYRTKYSLRDHQRAHTGDRPHRCAQCGLRFALRSNLVMHNRYVHQQDRRYKCDLCDKRFKRLRQLRYHQLAHRGERPHPCPHCPLRLRLPEQLRQHLRTHTGDRPYSCAICGKAFARSDTLKLHLTTHSQQPKPFPCPQCAANFTRKAALVRHIAQFGHEDSPQQYVLDGAVPLDSGREDDVIQTFELVQSEEGSLVLLAGGSGSDSRPAPAGKPGSDGGDPADRRQLLLTTSGTSSVQMVQLADGVLLLPSSSANVAGEQLVQLMAGDVSS